MPKSFLDAYAARFAALRDILEPEMWIASFGSDLMGGPPFTLEGSVKPAPDLAASVQELRRSLLDRAERILDLIDREGFVLRHYPTMEFRGDLIPAKVTMGGDAGNKLMVPAEQVGIELRMSIACWPVAKESDDA